MGGTGLSTVALALLAHDLAGGQAGAVLGMALTLRMVAYVGISPVVGAFADRLPRRPLLIGLDLARAVFVACMLFVSEPWQVYLLMFLVYACSAGFTPTFQATIPDVLPDEGQYTRALSLWRLAYDLEHLVSPMLAAAALVLLSYDALFAANAVAFLISAGLVYAVKLPAPKPQGRLHGVWHNVTYGIRVYLKTPRLRGLFALSLAVAVAGAMVIVNTVVIVRIHFGGSKIETAVAFAAFGAGSMVVALLLPRLLEERSDRLFMILGGFVLGLGLVLGLTATNLITLLPVWLLIGSGSSLVQTPAGRLLKRSAQEADRPAIFAAQFALSHACWLLAYPLAGWLGSVHDLPTAFVVLAILAFTSTIAALFLWPRRDPVRLEHVHEAIEHEHTHVHDEHHQHEHDGRECAEPHSHPHRHAPVRHTHDFVIDLHHSTWPLR